MDHNVLPREELEGLREPTLKDVFSFQAPQILLVVLLIVVSSIANYCFLNTLVHVFPPIDVLPVLVNQDNRTDINSKMITQLELFFLSEERFLRENLQQVTLALIPKVEWYPNKIQIIYRQALQNITLRELIPTETLLYFTYSQRINGSMFDFRTKKALSEAGAFINQYLFALLPSTEIPESLTGLSKWSPYIFNLKVCFLGILICELILVVSTISSLLITFQPKIVYFSFMLTLTSGFLLIVFDVTVIAVAFIFSNPVFTGYNRLQYSTRVMEVTLVCTILAVCYKRSKLVYMFYRDEKKEDDAEEHVEENADPNEDITAILPSSSRYSDTIESNSLGAPLNVVSSSSKSESPQTLVPFPELGQETVLLQADAELETLAETQTVVNTPVGTNFLTVVNAQPEIYSPTVINTEHETDTQPFLNTKSATVLQSVGSNHDIDIIGTDSLPASVPTLVHSAPALMVPDPTGTFTVAEDERSRRNNTWQHDFRS